MIYTLSVSTSVNEALSPYFQTEFPDEFNKTVQEYIERRTGMLLQQSLNVAEALEKGLLAKRANEITLKIADENGTETVIRLQCVKDQPRLV